MILFAIVLCWGPGHSANAESLSAKLRSSTVLPYEAICVVVTLHLDKPLTTFEEDRREASLDRLRLRERLRGVILRDGAEECRFPMLFGSPWALVDGSDRDYIAQLCGFPYCFNEESRRKILYALPGEYTFLVHRSGAESKPTPVTIRKPQGDEIHALDIWAGLDYVRTGYMMLEQKGDQEVVETFRRLANEYPDTLYGRYALASMALWDFKRTFKEFNNRGGAAVWQPVARQLRNALLEEVPFLRKKMLFDLAVAEAREGNYAHARKTMEEVRKEFLDEETQGEATRFLKELTTAERSKEQGQNEQ